MVVDRILTMTGVRKPRPRASDEADEWQDCFECRIIGGGGLTALGSSVLYVAYTKRQVQGRATMLVGACVGASIMTIGVLRLLGVHLLKPNNSVN